MILTTWKYFYFDGLTYKKTLWISVFVIHVLSSTAELVVDKAMELKFVGGVYGGNIKPTPFICLTLKMLQIQPEKDIIVEFIKNEDFKWDSATDVLIQNTLILLKHTSHLFVDIDMSVCSERCTWGSQERPWTATNTWSRFTTITERSRLRTEMAVSFRSKTSQTYVLSHYHGAFLMNNSCFIFSGSSFFECGLLVKRLDSEHFHCLLWFSVMIQSLSWCTWTSSSTSSSTQRGCVTSSCPAFRWVHQKFAWTSCQRHLMMCMCVRQKRHVLEETEMLDPRISALEEDLDEVESSEEEDEEEEKV